MRPVLRAPETEAVGTPRCLLHSAPEPQGCEAHLGRRERLPQINAAPQVLQFHSPAVAVLGEESSCTWHWVTGPAPAQLLPRPEARWSPGTCGGTPPPTLRGRSSVSCPGQRSLLVHSGKVHAMDTTLGPWFDDSGHGTSASMQESLQIPL